MRKTKEKDVENEFVETEVKLTGNLSTVKKKKIFLAAFAKADQNISAACIKAGITRRTFYDWKSSDPEFETELEFVIEANVDIGESALLKKVKKGDIKAITYYLNTHGKKRGYGAPKQIENKIVDDFEGKTVDEIRSELESLRAEQNDI